MRRGLLASRDDLKKLGDRINRKPFDFIYGTLRKRCALILETAPVSESQWRLLSQSTPAAALRAARITQGRMLDLLVAHHIEPNQAYRDRAIEELKNLLSWSTWVDPSHGAVSVDLCTAEAAVAAVLALDWLYEDISEVERLRIVHALRHRVIDPYRRAVAEKAWWYSCYHSWNAVVNSGCGLAALALSDEEPSALEAYQLAKAGLKHFFDALGREGGWDEGIGYWGYAMRYVLLLGESASRTIDNQSIFHSRGMDMTGLFPVYFTPNGQYAGFGDTPAVPLYGALYLLVKRYGVKEVTWWLDNYGFHRDASTTDWSAAGLAMISRPMDAEAPLAPDLQTVRVFHEIGWAAIADRWPKPAFYVSAKTGDLSANHSRRDMCSLNVQVDGEMLLTDFGMAPYDLAASEGPNGEFYQVQAASHNTLLVGRRDHRIDAQGTIVEAQGDRDHRWLACYSGTACGDDVHHVRHVVMLCNARAEACKTLLVLDEVQNNTSEKVDLFWHSAGRITLDEAKHSGTIQGQKAMLHFALGSTSALGVKVLHRTTGTHGESILHATVEPSTRILVLSAFSREAIRGKIELKKASGGEVRVKAGDAEVTFKEHKRHLQLEDLLGI